MLDEYEAHTDKTDAYALLVLRSLIFIYLNSGQLEQAFRVAQVLLQGSTNTRIAIMKNWADWYLGLVCYQRNDLDAAAQYFTQIVENRYTAQITVYRDAVAGLALIHQSRGKSHEAWQMVESISQFDMEQRGSEDERTRSLRARLHLLQDNLEDAGKWADSFTGPPPDLPLIWLEEPQVTRARILARGAEANPGTAMQVLDALDEIAERTQNTRYRIEILALRASALDALGETSQADAGLLQALDLARPGGFSRVFIDLGEPIQAMLCRLEQQGHAVEMVRRILAAFPKDGEHLEGSGQTVRSPAPGAIALIEPLTPREQEVLNLLRGPSSIKEIALKLHISYATAKRHTINLYAKLGANQRWDAVARAEELDILPPR
jgi:LuxR family maltose regulon positive regulatory protein